MSPEDFPLWAMKKSVAKEPYRRDCTTNRLADVGTLTKTELAFGIGDRVNIDNCKDLVGHITAITWRHPTLINYEVSWVTQGRSESCVIEGWRLTPAEASHV